MLPQGFLGIGSHLALVTSSDGRVRGTVGHRGEWRGLTWTPTLTRGAGGTSTQSGILTIASGISIQEERDTCPLVSGRCRCRGSSPTGTKARVQIAVARVAREGLGGLIIAPIGSGQCDSSKIQIVSLSIAKTHLNNFGNKVHNLIVFFQDAVYFSKSGLLAKSRQLDQQLELAAVPGDVVGNLHEDPLVLAGRHDVAEHANQLVDPVTLLGEDLGLGEEVLRGLDLAVAAGEAVHVGSDREHKPGPLEDVIVVTNIFVVVKNVAGRGQPGPAAIVLIPG